LLVCLSSSEACPRVINEAKILSTPTVSTNFDTIYEYLEDGKNGIISSLETIQNSIVDILQNKELYSKIKTEISNFHFDNSLLVKKIEKVLNY
jgi:glycosyltransferase involved in cell wall biosynthesis